MFCAGIEIAVVVKEYISIPKTPGGDDHIDRLPDGHAKLAHFPIILSGGESHFLSAQFNQGKLG